jgi:DNA-binding XRE family transcriptional regulator
MAPRRTTRSELNLFANAAGLPPPEQRRFLRVQAGQRQTDVARQIGVTRETAVRWETGATTPRGKHLAAYVALLDAFRQQILRPATHPQEAGDAA